jgi:hypothetical protein
MSWGIASGDFNGDGIPDFVVGNTYSNGSDNVITVFLADSNGSGTISNETYYSGASTANLEYVAVADFNKDGKLDIAATDTVNGGIQIFTGNGDGTFTVGPTYATDTGTYGSYGIATADFNGDGCPDLAVVNNTNSNASADVGVLLSKCDGTGAFESPANYKLSAAPAYQITAGILVNGQIDLVVPLASSSAIATFLGNGKGAFSSEQAISLANTTFRNPYAAAIGDLNGDGIPDLAITVDAPKPGILLFLGEANGSFKTPTELHTTQEDLSVGNPYPQCLQIADINGDGIPDLVYTNSNFATVGILYGQGGGAFYSPVEYPAGGSAFGVAVASLTNNGVEDVVVSGNSRDFSGITVLLNTGAPTSTTVSSNHNPAPTGTAVTFTAKVTAKGGPPNGETVTFKDGTATLGTGTLTSGTATFQTSKLVSGSHKITATYPGDANYVGSTSAILTQVVAVPSYTLSSNPTTQTVTAGSPAAYTITLTPSTDYDGAVTFACPTSLPTGVSCSFAPNPLTSTGSGPVTSVLTITTAAPSADMFVPANVEKMRNRRNLLGSFGAIGLLGIVLTGAARKRKLSIPFVIMTVVTLLLMMAWAGCGGSSSPPPASGGSGGTPSGSYPLTVTATGTAGTNGGNTSPQQLNITLVVQ